MAIRTARHEAYLAAPPGFIRGGSESEAAVRASDATRVMRA
jgi:hypothetical protein